MALSEQMVRNSTLRALDLCCGTGDYCELLAPRLGMGGTLTAVDFSPQMIERVQKRLIGLGYREQIRFVVDDATSLNTQAESSFNLCTIGFGLRNVDSIANCLQSVYRVLEPGGELIILDLSKPVHLFILPFFLVYMHIVVPLAALMLNGHLGEYRWLIESLKDYPTHTRLTEQLSSCGFRNVKTLRWFGGVIAVHFGVK